MRYPHLYLIDWPFQIIPDDQYCTFMADREQATEDIHRIVSTFSRRDQSTIHVIWAWYGAGKTHTLKYLSHLCLTDHQHSIIPVYMEFPRGTRSFLDIYRKFIEGLDREIVEHAFLEVFTSHQKYKAQRELDQDYPDLSKAMRMMCAGREDEAATAYFWMRAEHVSLRDLRKIGINARIERPEQAIQVISWLIRLFHWARPQETSPPARILWCIDEFQRIEELKQQIIDEINGCLQAVFNRCPRSFSLFLSFSGTPAKKMPSWLSRELADRIGMEKVIVLPPLTMIESIQFIQDVLDKYRSPAATPPSPQYPFTEESIKAVVAALEEKKAEMKPRNIMQACSVILEETEVKIENNTLQTINADLVRKILKDRSFVDTEDKGSG